MLIDSNNFQANKYANFFKIFRKTVKMIPTIDCSPIAGRAFELVSFDDYSKVAREIGSAMTGIGMCNLINHGVPMEKVFGYSVEF